MYNPCPSKMKRRVCRPRETYSARRLSKQALRLPPVCHPWSEWKFFIFLDMGPDANAAGKITALPARPKLSWDIKRVPWTDERGPRDELVDAVDLWCDFHDMLDNFYFNKIPKRLCGTILRSQLCRPAKDQARVIGKDISRAKKVSKPKRLSSVSQNETHCLLWRKCTVSLSRWWTPVGKITDYSAPACAATSQCCACCG